MIVVLVYDLDEDIANQILDQDLHAEDAADWINEAAQGYGDQVGAWHFKSTSWDTIETWLGLLWNDRGEVSSYG